MWALTVNRILTIILDTLAADSKAAVLISLPFLNIFLKVKWNGKMAQGWRRCLPISNF